MKCLTGFSVVALLLALSVSGHAGDSALFGHVDTDKSGHVSKNELLKADLGVVTNQNGQQQLVHRDLLKEGKAAALTEEQKRLLFEKLDKDKDGYVTWKEWSRASPDGFMLLKF